MDGRESSETIEVAAAQWVARMDRAPLTGLEDRQLQDWLRGDPRRRGAFVRARALWLHPGTLLTAASRSAEHTGPQPFVSAPPRSQVPGGTPMRHGRQRFLRWTGAVAASLVLSVFLFVSVPVPVAYATAKGEMRRIPLADGSTLTLNTDSRVEVYEENHRPLVKVRRGEVFVEAAANAEPLQVEVDGRRLDARAAAFVVRKLDGKPTQVVVQGGQVGLPATPTKPVTLVANMRASLKAAHGKVEVALLSADQMHRELAWREGKLAFYGETLEYAAAEFARYSDTRIVFADTRLANAPITGLFAANNPAGFSRAVAEVFGAQVRLETRKKIVIASED